MSRFQFIHTADLHLDSPLLGLERYDGAPVEEFRGAIRKALDNLVDLAVQEEVRFVLVAGDLFDGDCRDFNTPRHLRRKMQELDDANVAVYVVQGNHDAQTRMRKSFRLQLPPNVHLLSTKRPETVELEDVGVAIHGQGYSTQAVTDDLSAGYPEPRRGLVNIGLLHTTVAGYEKRDDYAPSTIDGLVAKGYDYWALGHVHRRAVIRDGRPWIVYPGCIQGRHVNETGEKGCTLVTVDAGEIEEVAARPLDVLRWARCGVDAGGCATRAEVASRAEAAIAREVEAAEGRLLAVRVEVTGACTAHRELALDPSATAAEVREIATDRFPDQVWVESVRLGTRAAVDLAEMAGRDDAIGSLLAALEREDAIREAIDDVRAELGGLVSKLPLDPRSEEARIDLDDREQLERLVEDVRQLLAAQLLAGGEGR